MPGPSRPGEPVNGDDELLLDGQEEVFSRAEIELGRIEHHSGSEPRSGPDKRTPDAYPQSRSLGGRADGVNQSTPIFDPAASPGETDSETGGARPVPVEGGRRSLGPRTHTPGAGGLGVRLPLSFWLALAALFAVVMLAMAVIS